MRLRRNKERRFGSAASYWWARVNLSGQNIWLAFTENDVRVARDRARNNPEDVPRPWWRKLLRRRW